MGQREDTPLIVAMANRLGVTISELFDLFTLEELHVLLRVKGGGY